MSNKMKSLLVLSLVPILMLSFAIPLTHAQTTKYSVVVSNPPRFPQDVWVAASSGSGNWVGGGSVCLVGGVIYSMAKVTGTPLPPNFNPNSVQMILVFSDQFDGGIGATPYPLGIPAVDNDNFYLESAIKIQVDHGLDTFFPPEFFSIFGYVTKARLTFNYIEGRNIQPVMFWLYLRSPFDVWIPILPEYPRTLMTVVNTVN